MNRKQLNSMKEQLPSLSEYSNWTKEQKYIDKVIRCVEMINSCIVYGTDFLNSHYSNSYIEELGYEKVKELYFEQIDYFKTCTILSNVHIDEENVCYSSVVEN